VSGCAAPGHRRGALALCGVEPPKTLTGPADLLAGYLDHYRAAALDKLDGLTDDQLRRGLVPSGWSPLELLKHLAHVERRWLRWGFLGERVEDPWGDHTPDRERWALTPDDTAGSVTAFFLEQCARSREIVAGASLDAVSAVGGRFQPGDERPTLIWILFHVLQEYARHVGHLEIVRELADG
jgi:hypothetical protein